MTTIVEVLADTWQIVAAYLVLGAITYFATWWWIARNRHVLRDNILEDLGDAKDPRVKRAYAAIAREATALVKVPTLEEIRGTVVASVKAPTLEEIDELIPDAPVVPTDRDIAAAAKAAIAPELTAEIRALEERVLATVKKELREGIDPGPIAAKVTAGIQPSIDDHFAKLMKEWQTKLWKENTKRATDAEEDLDALDKAANEKIRAQGKMLPAFAAAQVMQRIPGLEGHGAWLAENPWGYPALKPHAAGLMGMSPAQFEKWLSEAVEAMIASGQIEVPEGGIATLGGAPSFEVVNKGRKWYQ